MYQSSVLSSNALHLNITVATRTPVVFVADADGSIRKALEKAAAVAGWQVKDFGAAGLFGLHPAVDTPSCLVLDISLPGSLQLQQRLAARRPDMSIICITDNVPVTVQAMKAGAVDALAKPVDAKQLTQAIEHAFQLSEASLQQRNETRQLEDRYASLSLRERQVMELVVSGRLNKQVGGDLGISEITVKAHRGRVMRKMNARSLAALVKMAGQLHTIGTH